METQNIDNKVLDKKEKRKLYMREYTKKNKDKIYENQKKYLENKKLMKQLNEDEREKILLEKQQEKEKLLLEKKQRRKEYDREYMREYMKNKYNINKQKKYEELLKDIDIVKLCTVLHGNDKLNILKINI